MGQFEILQWLVNRREMGDASYRTYVQIHEAMKRDGYRDSYPALWRGINRLYSSELIEAVVEGGILQRKVLFRAKVISTLRGSDMKRVHNTYQGLDEKPPRDSAEAAGGRPAQAPKARRPAGAARGAKRRRILW